MGSDAVYRRYYGRRKNGTRLLVEAEQMCYTLTCVFVYEEENYVLQ